MEYENSMRTPRYPATVSITPNGAVLSPSRNAESVRQIISSTESTENAVFGALSFSDSSEGKMSFLPCTAFLAFTASSVRPCSGSVPNFLQSTSISNLYQSVSFTYAALKLSLSFFKFILSFGYGYLSVLNAGEKRFRHSALVVYKELRYRVLDV